MRLYKIAALFALLACLCLCPGCRGNDKEANTLWVVTEKTNWDGMNWQTEMLIEQFQQKHPEITVELEILPQEDSARADRLNRLRYLIAAEAGPDVFLLPTDTTVHGNDWRSWHLELKLHEMEPLFKNVEQTMYNGLFADLGAYYDADADLKTEDLNQQIMNAGAIQDGSFRDGRYILPLRYDFPVLYVDRENLPNFGLTMEDIGDNVLQVMDAAIASGDEKLACSAEPFWVKTERSFSLLGQPVDLDAGNVTVTKEQITDLLRKVQTIEAMVADSNDHRRELYLDNFYRMYYEKHSDGYIMGYSDTAFNNSWRVDFVETKRFPSRLPMRVGTTADAVYFKAVTKSNHKDYVMLPLRGTDGQLTACVTWYGAVGAASKHIPEAYEFLRLFLTEDAQFEAGRPVRRINIPILSTTDREKPHWTSLMEEGWPVRQKDAAENMWRILKTFYGRGSIRTNEYTKGQSYYFPHFPDMTREPVPAWVKDLPLNVRAFIAEQLYNDDLAELLDANFDHVSFGNALEQEFSRMICSLNDLSTGVPTDADIDTMAEELIEKLRWQILEG